MDLSSVIGFLVGFGGLWLGMTIEGADLSMYLNPSAFCISVIGTIGVSIASANASTTKNIFRIIRVAFRREDHKLLELISTMVSFTDKSRREGLLALEQDIDQLDNAFLAKGLQLVVDGIDPELVGSILQTEIDQMAERHKGGIDWFEAAGGYAPTLGICGTVLGMVEILGNLEHPEELGPMISVAFLATLYGISSANLLYFPLASKLRQKNREELIFHEVILQGVLAIQAGDNPRVVEEKLKAYLDPESRKSSADQEGLAEEEV
ncbi:MAG: flagellar motor protein [Candidatus Wallbacteria bacterium]|nr:flagellar motor protein [Candidatus Wallbacteria bacterium]